MRVRTQSSAKITEDAAATDILFSPDVSVATVMSSDGFTKETSGRFVIAASGSYTIPLGNVSAPKGVWILATSDYDLTIGTRDPLEMRKSDSALTTENLVTQMHLSGETVFTIENPSSTAALNGRWIIWG